MEFRKGRSTSQAITELTDTLRKALIAGVFLDFSKAFDTVNHDTSIKKLEANGFRRLPMKWFSSSLRNRQQALGDTESPMKTMGFGIPKCSTLRL